jgi:ATP-dependent RNA helicase DeaD
VLREFGKSQVCSRRNTINKKQRRFMKFEDFNFKPELAEAIKKAGFKEPSPIQKEAIPLILEGNDLIGQAHTGTGKTAAFALPVLNNMELNKGVEALIITPTRELAMQVSDEVYRFGKELGIKSATVYGGTPYNRQIEHIKSASVVVATPGRLIDLLDSKRIKLNPSVVILDEADEMLDMGFLDDIKKIFSYLNGEQQTLLFSATMSKEIKALAQKILKDPKSISITKSEVTNANISQEYYVVDEREKDDALIRLIDFYNPNKSIIFCRMRREVDRLSTFLNSQGYKCNGLHGDMSQREREQTIRDFKKGALDILIATDVAARGLDVNDVSHVFNYHIPFDSQSYVHRIGRTGRAGKDGVAISIVTPSEFRALQKIQKSVGSTIESKVVPRISDIEALKSGEAIQKIIDCEVTDNGMELVNKLKEGFDISTIALKLASLLSSNNEIKGKDNIGKSLEDIKRLLKNAKDDRGSSRGRNRGRGGNGRRRSNSSRGRNSNSNRGGSSRGRRG